jgi:hypothetical protein
MLPTYKLTINDSDETGVDYNAFVDTPAHLKSFLAFNKAMPYEFKEEQRIVTGVMMSANTLIYRNSPDIGEHQVFFDVPTIKQIVLKFFKNSFGNNVNRMHDNRDTVKGAIMFESYLIDKEKGINPPLAFAKQNLQDGTWIASYKIEDNQLWNEVKSGKFQGFSVEGIFERMQVNLKSNNKQKMKREKVTLASFFKKYFEADEVVAEVELSFTDVTAIDGTVLSYEGELAIDVPIFVTDAEGNKLPAPEGDYQVTDAEGKTLVISVNANGLIAEFSTVEEEAEEVESEMDSEFAKEVAELMKSAFAKIEELTEEVKKLKTEKESKFSAEAKSGANKESKLTISEMIKLKK